MNTVTVFQFKAQNVEILVNTKDNVAFNAIVVADNERSERGSLLDVLKFITPALDAYDVTATLLETNFKGVFGEFSVRLVTLRGEFYVFESDNEDIGSPMDVEDAFEAYTALCEYHDVVERPYAPSSYDEDDDEELEILSDDDLSALFPNQEFEDALEIRKYRVKRTCYVFHVQETWQGDEWVEAAIDRYRVGGYYIDSVTLLASDNEFVQDYIEDCERS